MFKGHLRLAVSYAVRSNSGVGNKLTAEPVIVDEESGFDATIVTGCRCH